MTSLLFISKRTLLGGDGSTASPPVSGARTLPSRATMLPWPLPANPDLPHCNKAMPSYDIIYLRWCAIESRVRRGLTDRHAQFMLTEAEWTDFRLHAREAHLHQFARMFPVGGTLMCSGPPGGGPCSPGPPAFRLPGAPPPRYPVLQPVGRPAQIAWRHPSVSHTFRSSARPED